jgi:hypothetical protein
VNLKYNVSCDSGPIGALASDADLPQPCIHAEGLMGNQTTTALCAVLMAAVIVAVDILFFKNRFWERLSVNIGIVLVFGAFYFRFLKRP